MFVKFKNLHKKLKDTKIEISLYDIKPLFCLRVVYFEIVSLRIQNKYMKHFLRIKNFDLKRHDPNFQS